MQIISSHGLAPGMLAEIEPHLPELPGRRPQTQETTLDPESATDQQPSLDSVDQKPIGKFPGSIDVPLEFRGRKLGVFSLLFADLHTVHGEAIHLLRPVGRFFGLALENAQLEHENLQASLLQERQAMAAEIHDSLAQSLTFARMRMPVLRDALEKSDTDRGLQIVNDLEQELGSASRRMRELITHFRTGLGETDLRAALDKAAERFMAQSGIHLDYQCAVTNFDLASECQVQVMHIVREALANVRKHSGASKVKLLAEDIGDALLITIEDDGAGFASNGLKRPLSGLAPEGVGLRIMRDRAHAISANLVWEPVPDAGTRVTLTIPKRSATAAGS
ncbi:MAG: histidine kinase [Quisquiliibacterium sp.]